MEALLTALLLAASLNMAPNNAARAQSRTDFVKVDAANRTAEKQANSFKDLLAVRQKAQLRKYPTNKPLPLGEIRTYLEEVKIPANLEERWVLAQFLSLNGWDLFGSKDGETKFNPANIASNSMLSSWIGKNEKLFKDGNITKKDLAIAK